MGRYFLVGAFGAVCFLALGIFPAGAVEEEGQYILFEGCPYSNDDRVSTTFWMHKDWIAGIGNISAHYFSGSDFAPDPKMFEDCAVLILQYNRTIFIKGAPAFWERKLELIH